MKYTVEQFNRIINKILFNEDEEITEIDYEEFGQFSDFIKTTTHNRYEVGSGGILVLLEDIAGQFSYEGEMLSWRECVYRMFHKTNIDMTVEDKDMLLITFAK